MKKYKFIIGIIVLLLIAAIIGYTIADNLENNSEVEPSTELTYYLNVSYDGVDVSGIESSDSVVTDVQSNIIFVEDKIPLGLEFTGFVETLDGSIGSVKRNNAEVSCLGKVIDDTNEDTNEGVWNNDHTIYTYHGLHYNASNRTVTFRVNNLHAGCVLTVGIKTNTPSTIDDKSTVNKEKRRDFYNYATIREKIISDASNLVHVFIGSTSESMYTVTYNFASGTPSLVAPQTTSYAEGQTVGVAPDIYLEGYSFNGWTSEDVTITDGKFVMPNRNITITGSFTATNQHTVTYSIDGVTPDGYVLPTTKNYYPNSLVYLDSLKVGDIINGYKFLGWSSNDVSISYNSFEMPNSNVSIVGRFSPVTYNVNYEFIGNVIPPNSDELIPVSSTYSEGDIVVLGSVSDTPGYKFLGWFKEDGFTMPNKNVTVYGEWKRFLGYFEPTISMEILNNRDYYRLNDTISYKITVTNTANYPINNVIIKENNGAYFINGTGYTIQNNLATINEIAANSSKIVYAEYKVSSSDSNTYTNDVELISAIASDDYELKDKAYETSLVSNLQSKVKVCINIDGVDLGNTFRISLNNNNYEYSSNLKKNECMTYYVNPGIYTVKEILPQEYSLKQITGNISTNGGSLTVTQGNEYEINFVNEFKNKKFMHSYGDVVNKVGGGQ